MGDKTGIQWTDATWNPVVGCSKVSPGCANCYAERMHSTRLSGRSGYPDFLPWTPENAEHNVTLLPDRLPIPLHWTKPRMIFVNSMSDLFHPLVPDDYIDQVFAVMAAARQHVFQVLTKRPERMRAYMADTPNGAQREMHVYGDFARVVRPFREAKGWPGWPLPNVWLGASVENARWLTRVDELRATPAAVRFLSCEPLLGPLTGRVIEEAQISGDAAYARGPDGSVSYSIPIIATKHRPMLDLTGIAWVIAGGESGGPPERMLVERDRTGRWVPKPHEEEWARGIRDEAARQGVAFLWKQWGGPTPHSGGRELDGRTWDEYPVTEA